MASYAGEYAEGYIDGIGGPALRDSRFRVYKIQEGDDASITSIMHNGETWFRLEHLMSIRTKMDSMIQELTYRV